MRSIIQIRVKVLSTYTHYMFNNKMANQVGFIYNLHTSDIITGNVCYIISSIAFFITNMLNFQLYLSGFR